MRIKISILSFFFAKGPCNMRHPERNSERHDPASPAKQEKNVLKNGSFPVDPR